MIKLVGALLALMVAPAMATEAQEYFNVTADGQIFATQAGVTAINQLTTERSWRLDITATNPNATSTVTIVARPKAPALPVLGSPVTFTTQANISTGTVVGTIPNYGHPQTMMITGGAP